MPQLAQFVRRQTWDRLPSSTRHWLKYDGFARLMHGFAAGAPRVQVFDPPEPDERWRRVTADLRRVNAYRRTELCRTMRRCGSDKGLGRHNYSTVYASLFGDLRSKRVRVFELGIGTNDPNLKSTMGSAGVPGASLRAWSQFFPSGEIFGADIDKSILFQEERIRTFYCDQTDPRSIAELWSQDALREGFDIVIEDGLHTFDANITFLTGSLAKVKPGGYYIVEDVSDSDLPAWQRLLHDYRQDHSDVAFSIVSLPWINIADNSLVVARRTR